MKAFYEKRKKEIIIIKIIRNNYGTKKYFEIKYLLHDII